MTKIQQFEYIDFRENDDKKYDTRKSDWISLVYGHENNLWADFDF